jgi:hypothetical protein
MICMITSEKDVVKHLTVTMPVSSSVFRSRFLSRKTSPLNDTGLVTFTVGRSHHKYKEPQVCSSALTWMLFLFL